MQVKDYECKICGSRDFVFKPKDEHITGIYCSSCGRWLKWADKKEKSAYNVAQGNNSLNSRPDKLKQLYLLAVEVNRGDLEPDIRESVSNLIAKLFDRYN